MIDLAELGRADHQRANMRRIERQRRAAVADRRGRRRACRGRQSELTSPENWPSLSSTTDDLAVQAVAAHDLEAAVEHQPGRRVAHANVVDQFARREMLRRRRWQSAWQFRSAKRSRTGNI